MIYWQESAVTASKSQSEQARTLVIPVLSPSGEAARLVSKNRIEIVKPEGTVVIECNAALSIKPTRKGRVFNMVPGAEAVPILIEIPKDASATTTCTISVK